MKDLTKGRVLSQIILFALPMLFGNVFQQMYNITDSIIVGHFVGKEGLAAVGASFPIIFLLISLLIGITSGMTIIISQYYGAKDFVNVKKAVDTMYVFLFFASLIITFLGLILTNFIFEWIGLPKDILPKAKIYIHIYFLGVIMFAGFHGTGAILRGLGDSKTPFYFLIVSTIINIVFDFVLIIIFKIGIAGAALATLIAQTISCIAIVFYVIKKHQLVAINLKTITFDKEIFKKTIIIGLPSGLQQTFVALGIMALYSIVNKFGTDTVAAFSVASRIDSFATLPTMNFSLALTTFVGQNIGANRIDRVKKGFLVTLLITVVISLCATFFISFFSNSLMKLFTHDANVIRLGASYLIIVSSFYFIFSAMFITNGLFRGTGNTIIPMFITLISLWLIRIPFSYILSQKFGTNGIWWGIPIAWFIGLIIAYGYYLSGKWKKQSIVNTKPIERLTDLP